MTNPIATSDPAGVPDSPPPWHAKYPAPRKTDPAWITREDLLQEIRSGQKPGKDFLLVDLRRNDHEGGTIRGSLNLPAQTLYNSLPTLLELCKSSSGIKRVIFYCGSSTGRGTRAAGWFDDLITSEGANDQVKSLILLDGIKGWVRGGEEFTAMMDEYEPKVWNG